MVSPKSVLLIITGSVASYKSLELVRLLRGNGIDVTAILTKGGAKFITPLAVSSLTGTKTYDDLFSLTDEVEMGHIELSRVADCVLVAPASADILAKMAAGIADDLATTALLATNKPVIVAPAMNHKMWSHPATQRNVAQLKKDGIAFIEPTEGEMACGEYGVGRMAEPAAIAEYVMGKKTGSATTHGALAGKHAIVTSGPTAEALDPVRYLGNRSSGKQGHAIAAALAAAGARVTLVAGNVSLPDPLGVTTIRAEDADSMLAAVSQALPADIFVSAAAVADWKLAEPATQKMKKQRPSLSLELVPTVDVLGSIAKHKQRPQLVIGFAAETEKLLDHARAKLRSKACDWIVANDVSGSKVFGQEENRVTLITDRTTENWQQANKQEVATKLVEKIVAHFATTHLVKGKSA